MNNDIAGIIITRLKDFPTGNVRALLKTTLSEFCPWENLQISCMAKSVVSVKLVACYGQISVKLQSPVVLSMHHMAHGLPLTDYSIKNNFVLDYC